MDTIHTGDKPHRTSDHTSDDLQKRYLDLLEKKPNGDSLYFCPVCRLHVPKQTPDGPCPMCDSSLWNIDNPLTDNIIDTSVLKQYMLETFRGCIKPFAVTGKQTWGDTSFLYRKDDSSHPIGNGRDGCIEKIEMWRIARLTDNGYCLSLCVRWTETFRCSCQNTSITFLKFMTARTTLFSWENDDMTDTVCCSHIFSRLPEYLAGGSPSASYEITDGREKVHYAHIDMDDCCEPMLLAGNRLSGGLNTRHLLSGGLTELYWILRDFSHIPYCWQGRLQAPDTGETPR